MVVHCEKSSGVDAPPKKITIFFPPPSGVLGVRGSAARLASSHIEPSRYVLSTLGLGIIDTARRLLKGGLADLGKTISI